MLNNFKWHCKSQYSALTTFKYSLTTLFILKIIRDKPGTFRKQLKFRQIAHVI